MIIRIYKYLFGIDLQYRKWNGSARFTYENSACNVPGHRCILCKDKK